jgi:hypothetical protein
VELEEVSRRVSAALARFLEVDHYLLEHDLSERCIAARVAFHLQKCFPEYMVDVEYNRAGWTPKRLELPDECANYRDWRGESLVVPDVIVHMRGPRGPNLFGIGVQEDHQPRSSWL